MSPQGYDPFDDLVSSHLWKPPVDVYETDNGYILRAEVPEVAKKDLQLRVQGNQLEIIGERKFDSICGEDHYEQLESFRGRFRRTFVFPTEVDRDSITAELQNGILTVRLAKYRSTKRRVEVREQ